MDQGTPGIDWTRIDEGIRGFWQLVDELYRVKPSDSDIQRVLHILQTQPMPEAVRRCLKDALPKKEPTQRFAAERFEPKNQAAITKPSTLCVLPPEELDTVEEVSLPTQEIPKIKVKEYGPDVSGLLAQPEDAVLHLVPPGPHDLRIGASTYREVDVPTTVELLRRGILLGMEVRSGGQWVPVTAHPAFRQLVESAHVETERVLRRLLPEAISELASTEEITAPAAPWDIEVDALMNTDSLEFDNALTQELDEDLLETAEDQQITAELAEQSVEVDPEVDRPTTIQPARRRPPDKEPIRPVEMIKGNETAELSRALIRTTESNLVIPSRTQVRAKRKNKRFLWMALPALIALAGLAIWGHLEREPEDAAPLATTTSPFVVHLAKKTLNESLPETSSDWLMEQASVLVDNAPGGALEIYEYLLVSRAEDPSLHLDLARAALAAGDLRRSRASALQGLEVGAEPQEVLELLREAFRAESAPDFEDLDISTLGRPRVLKNVIVFEQDGARTYLLVPDRNETWLSHVAASRYLELVGISTGFNAVPVRVDVATLNQVLPKSDRGVLGDSGTIHTAIYTHGDPNGTPIPLELKEIWLPWLRGERLDESLGAQLLPWDQVDPKSRPDLIESAGLDFGVVDLFRQIQSIFLADFLLSHPSRLESNARRFGQNTTVQDGRLVTAQPIALRNRTSRRALWLSNYIGELPPETRLLLEALEPDIAEARIVPEGLESRGDIDRRLELLWERRDQLLK